MRKVLVFTFLIVFTLTAQRQVDPKYTYTRIITVVPFVGAGTADDPKRPQYAPAPAAQAALSPSQTSIMGFMQQISDDGKYALVEYVAKDLSAFTAILNDTTIKVFIKGKDSKSDIEAALRKYKKDFDLNAFGVVMP